MTDVMVLYLEGKLISMKTLSSLVLCTCGLTMGLFYTGRHMLHVNFVTVINHCNNFKKTCLQFKRQGS